jgi:hypothetical protein
VVHHREYEYDIETLETQRIHNRTINEQWATERAQIIRNDIQDNSIDEHFALVMERYEKLYNIQTHYALRDAIVEELYVNR